MSLLFEVGFYQSDEFFVGVVPVGKEDTEFPGFRHLIRKTAATIVTARSVAGFKEFDVGGVTVEALG